MFRLGPFDIEPTSVSRSSVEHPGKSLAHTIDWLFDKGPQPGPGPRPRSDPLRGLISHPRPSSRLNQEPCSWIEDLVHSREHVKGPQLDLRFSAIVPIKVLRNGTLLRSSVIHHDQYLQPLALFAAEGDDLAPKVYYINPHWINRHLKILRVNTKDMHCVLICVFFSGTDLLCTPAYRKSNFFLIYLAQKNIMHSQNKAFNCNAITKSNVFVNIMCDAPYAIFA